MTTSLNDKKILVTREASQADEFIKVIKRRGGVAITCPLLKVVCLDKKININHYEWIFFTSANGVKCYFNQATLNKNIKIAVVGHKTEEALIKQGYKADFIPSVYNAETLAKEFIQGYPHADNIILVRGDKSRNVLPEAFEALGLNYVKHLVYQTLINYEAKTRLNELLSSEIDYVTFMSPSTLTAAKEMLTAINFDRLKKSNVICIGTTTEKQALEMGCRSVYIPDEFTAEGMLDKISQLIKK